MLIDKVTIDQKISVREARMLTGLTQREFAVLVQIPYPSYARKETGKSPFFAAEVARICFQLHLPMELICV